MYARQAPITLKKIIGKYKVPILPLTNNSLVVDCGVGDGYFFWFYHSFFQNYIGVEASTKNIKTLQKKIELCEKNKTSKILHNACYSKDDKELEIKTIVGNSVLEKGFTANNNSIYYEVKEKRSNWNNPISKSDIVSEKVKSISLNGIFSKFNLNQIDFLKVDIEGAEYDFLMHKDLSNIRYLAVEAPKNNEKRATELLDYICRQGFSKMFDNGKDITFAKKDENLDETYFIDFPTLYFSKINTDFPFGKVELDCYTKPKKLKEVHYPT